MDRFIDANFDILCLWTLDLKSNMDRFIDDLTKIVNHNNLI